MTSSKTPANPLPFKMEGTNNLEPYLTEREVFFEGLAVANGLFHTIQGGQKHV